jgi:hypothetical protein
VLPMILSENAATWTIFPPPQFPGTPPQVSAAHALTGSMSARANHIRALFSGPLLQKWICFVLVPYASLGIVPLRKDSQLRDIGGIAWLSAAGKRQRFEIIYLGRCCGADVRIEEGFVTSFECLRKLPWLKRSPFRPFFIPQFNGGLRRKRTSCLSEST